MTNPHTMTEEQLAKCREAFVVKHYVDDPYPTIKFNGGYIQVHGDREDAEEFLTAIIKAAWSAAQPQVDILRLLAEIGNIANGIRARDGAPSGYCPDYFDNLVERIHAVCGGDCLRYLWATTPPTQPSEGGGE